jgi:hypothetical protein
MRYEPLELCHRTSSLANRESSLKATHATGVQALGRESG